ncbi:hypothetical protein KY336_02340 [Candidatus Woesearchaeota archaeon]|nr:hypothetical protein [Candidatus Woesearchaeota archaeon]
MNQDPTNEHHCPDNITLEERGAYASFVTRFRKGMPGGMTERERRILNRFCDGDIRKLDLFFQNHFKECPYCRRDYDEAIAQEAIFTDDSGDLHVRLLSDAAKDESKVGGSLIDLLDLTRKMEKARKRLQDAHGIDANKFIDYMGSWAHGEVDVRNPSEEHREMEQHLVSCKPCRDYFRAVINVAGYSKKKKQ